MNVKNRKCELDGCGRKHFCRGLCRLHYKRWAKWGSSTAIGPNRVIYQIVVTPTGCHEWQGGLAGRVGHQYPTWWNPSERRRVRMNRLVLEGRLGRKLRSGMHACHTCDNPLCINEYHLWEGTRSQNMTDCYRKGRSRGTFGQKRGRNETETKKATADSNSSRSDQKRDPSVVAALL